MRFKGNGVLCVHVYDVLTHDSTPLHIRIHRYGPAVDKTIAYYFITSRFITFEILLNFHAINYCKLAIVACNRLTESISDLCEYNMYIYVYNIFVIRDTIAAAAAASLYYCVLRPAGENYNPSNYIRSSRSHRVEPYEIILLLYITVIDV